MGDNLGYANEGLGRAIRELRLAAGMSQADLATAAHYGKGGAVSISRIENGQVRPAAKRLTAIAQALGADLNALVELAADESKDDEAPSENTQRAWADMTGSTKDRSQRIQGELTRRQELIRSRSEQFNTAHDAARDDFFLPFIAAASRIVDRPAPPTFDDLTAEATDTDGTRAGAKLRVQVASHGVTDTLIRTASGATAGAAAGGAAAYATFAAAAAFGSASTGTAIASLSGVAATNATLALLGGGATAAGGFGIAGGTVLLGSIVAAPAAILALGGLIWARRRHTAETRNKLDAATAELVAAETGFNTAIDAITSATQVLDTIAVHGSRAAQKWISSLPDGDTRWSDLSPEQRARHDDFVDLAGCQLSVATINFAALLQSRDDTDLQDQRALVTSIIVEAQAQIDDRI